MPRSQSYSQKFLGRFKYFFTHTQQPAPKSVWRDFSSSPCTDNIYTEKKEGDGKGKIRASPTRYSSLYTFLRHQRESSQKNSIFPNTLTRLHKALQLYWISIFLTFTFLSSFVAVSISFHTAAVVIRCWIHQEFPSSSTLHSSRNKFNEIPAVFLRQYEKSVAINFLLNWNWSKKEVKMVWFSSLVAIELLMKAGARSSLTNADS